MRLDKPQWCWLLYDPGNAAFALLVRAVFAPLFFLFCVKIQGHWSESEATANWALTCSLSGVAAGILSLYFGALADAAGRRKLALAIASFGGSTATLALAFTSDYRCVLVLYFAALAAYMAGNSFYDSLLVFVASPAEYSLLSSFAYGFGYLGGLLPFIGILTLGLLLKDKIVIARCAFILAAVWWAVFTIPLLCKVQEKAAGESRQLRWYDGFRQLWISLKHAFGNRNIRIFLIAYFLYIDGVSTILLMATPISVEIGIGENLLMAVMLMLQIIGLPATIFVGRWASRWNARNVVYILLLFYILAAVLVGGLSLTVKYEIKLGLFLAVALLIALAQGGIQALSRSLFGLLVPPGQAAEFFSVYNIFGKFTTLLGPVLIYLSSMWLGRSEYGVVMLIVPFLLGGWMLKKVDFPGK